MTTAQLDEAICHQYDNGRYMPLGADGGVLKYIMANIEGQWYRASITLDHEIAKIRRIWELTAVTSGNNTIDEIYDFTNTYYDLRRAA